MRKIFYFMISVCIIGLLMITPAFAEESPSDLLYKYGFISGDNGNLMVEQNLTRGQACVLLSEMYGKKTEASKFIFIQSFNDVTAKDWFAPYVTYAKSSGWISGYPDGSFKPNATVSKKEWSAMLMNALSYDYTWDTVELDLNTLGIEFSANNASALKRGEAFDAMWQSLLIPAKNDTLPLGIKLKKLPPSFGEANNTTETPNNTVGLDIESYRAIGLTELEFTFNGELKDKEIIDVSHVTIQQDGNFFLKPFKILVGDDHKSVHVIMNVPIIQNKAMNITFKNIEGQNGSVLEEKKLTGIQFADTILPQIKHAEIIGDYYIRVTFNEPIQSDEDLFPTLDPDFIPEVNSNDFVINNGEIYINQIKLIDNNKVAIINTSKKLTMAVKVKAQSSIKDYAGFNLYSTEVEALLAKDMTPPKVVSYIVKSATEVILIWDKEIKIVNSLSSAYYHNEIGNTIKQPMTDERIYGKEMTLIFTDKPLRAGENKVFVSAAAISDLNGTRNDLQSISITLPADTTGPTIVGEPELIDNRSFKVYFSELLKNTFGELSIANNYILKTKAGEAVKIAYSNYDSNTNVITLTASENLLGDYILEFKEIKDYYGNPLENTKLDITVKDMTVPEASDWTAKVFYTSNTEQNVIVTFDEPMQMSGRYSVLDKSNYTINGIQLSGLSASSTSIKKIDEQKVQITVARANSGGIDIAVDADTNAGVMDLIVGQVADVSGNLTEDEFNYVDLSEKSNIKVEAFRYIGNNEFEIIISDPVISVDISDFEITKNNVAYSIGNYSLGVDDKNRSVIRGSLNYTIDTYLGFFLRTVGQNTKTAYGESFSPYSIYLQMTEYISTGLRKVSINGITRDNIYYTKNTGIVSIEFTKSLNLNSISSLSFEIPGVEIDQVNVSGSVLQLHIKTSDQIKIKQYLTVQQKYAIKDVDGELIDNLSSRIEFIY